MFNDMPLQVMALMFRLFKPNSFYEIFEKQANNILVASLRRKEQPKKDTKYWIFDYQSRLQVD